MEKLTANASIQIQKPVNEVFSSIVSADKMNRYFIESATGDLETGKTVQWKFPEFDDVFPVTGKEIKQNEYVSFKWDGAPNMLVEIFLQPQTDHSTLVKVVEHEKEKTDAGIKQMMQQTEGWANFLSCLKANLEYNINLRKGAFDYMRTNK